MLGGGVGLADRPVGVDASTGCGRALRSCDAGRAGVAARRGERSEASASCGRLKTATRFESGAPADAAPSLGVLARHQRAQRERAGRAGLLGIGGKMLAGMAQAGRAPNSAEQGLEMFERSAAAGARPEAASGAPAAQRSGQSRRRARGAPIAARPIITARGARKPRASPRASSRLAQSPLTTTGMRTAATTSRTAAQSARPL